MTESNEFVENRPVPSEAPAADETIVKAAGSADNCISASEEAIEDTVSAVNETVTESADEIKEDAAEFAAKVPDIASETAEKFGEAVAECEKDIFTGAEDPAINEGDAPQEDLCEDSESVLAEAEKTIAEAPAAQTPAVPFTEKLKAFGASLKEKYDLHLPELTLGKKVLYGTLILIFIFQFVCWYGLSADAYAQPVSSLFSDGTWEKTEQTDHFGPYCSAEYELNEGKWNELEVDVGLGKLSAFLVLAKIAMILSLVAFAVYVLTLFANQDRLCPRCAGYNVNSIALSAYLGLITAALILGFLGILNGRDLAVSDDLVTYVSVYPAFGWFASAILTALAIAQVKKPALAEKVLARPKK